ncbi:hypothetical protein CLAFUR4_02722 [Fulvia fulva]|nr:hypothetical protein CLAFUR4_02722 [Fulvia fulva]WPV25970.1 hypothetical protein CLAFUW7_02726 [Fulvia fulva]
MVQVTKLAALAAVCTTPATAHPGEKHDPAKIKREIIAREHWAHQGKRSLDACSNTGTARRFAARNSERRAREARERPIFAPSITDGPYYVWGEMIRSNVVEDDFSDGIPLHLEVQYYDIETCQPIPDIYVDIWNANATGVYFGISTSGNYATGGHNSTYPRGIQGTNEDGAATFDTIFPGHYDGRAIHTHLLAHMNVTVMPNNTLLIGSGSVTQVGQSFWNEVLRTNVEATAPYNTNTQAIVSNADDLWSVLQASSDYDTFPEFLYLGDSIEDGLFAWKQIGLYTSADWTDDDYYSIAAYIGEDGGYANADSGFMGGGDGAGGNMTGSAMPSGTAAPAA